jgi:predicted ATP-dependent serine protease
VRVAEARKLGFTRVLLPSASAERLTRAERAGVELLPAARIDDALAMMF